METEKVTFTEIENSKKHTKEQLMIHKIHSGYLRIKSIN